MEEVAWAEAEWFWADWEPEWYGLCKCQGLGSQVWGKSKKSLRRPQAILSGRGERVLHQLSVAGLLQKELSSPQVTPGSQLRMSILPLSYLSLCSCFPSHFLGSSLSLLSLSLSLLSSFLFPVFPETAA